MSNNSDYPINSRERDDPADDPAIAWTQQLASRLIKEVSVKVGNKTIAKHRICKTCRRMFDCLGYVGDRDECSWCYCGIPRDE